MKKFLLNENVPVREETEKINKDETAEKAFNDKDESTAAPSKKAVITADEFSETGKIVAQVKSESDHDKKND